MSAILSLYGRLGQEPRPINTQSGKAMAVASVAVEMAARKDERHSEWFGLVAFGEQAERLLRQEQGEMVAVTGRLQLNHWTDREGNERQQWQVVVDTLVSARTVRPGGKQKSSAKARTDEPRQTRPMDAESPAEPDFDDPIPF